MDLVLSSQNGAPLSSDFEACEAASRLSRERIKTKPRSWLIIDHWEYWLLHIGCWILVIELKQPINQGFRVVTRIIPNQIGPVLKIGPFFFHVAVRTPSLRLSKIHVFATWDHSEDKMCWQSPRSKLETDLRCYPECCYSWWMWWVIKSFLKIPL